MSNSGPLEISCKRSTDSFGLIFERLLVIFFKTVSVNRTKQFNKRIAVCIKPVIGITINKNHQHLCVDFNHEKMSSQTLVGVDCFDKINTLMNTEQYLQPSLEQAIQTSTNLFVCRYLLAFPEWEEQSVSIREHICIRNAP